MNQTQTNTPVRTFELRSAADLLPQVTAQLANNAARAGKDAYNYLADLRSMPASKIQDSLSKLDLPSIRAREVAHVTEAALAVAAAALMDVSRLRRMTGTERIGEAMTLLDDRLSAGW